MPVMRARKPRETAPGAAPFVPDQHTLTVLRAAIPACKGCELYKHATQAVFGEGSASARVVLVGEVPGDSEDLAGRPFVGPAGKLLDDGLTAAGIPRSDAYVTNAVKHFKFTRRGKRRIHDKPTRYEITACRPWLGAELDALEPAILILLGATAAQSLLGTSFRVTKARGQALSTDFATYTFATVHPASVLRAPDDEARRDARDAFFADLALIGGYYKKL